MQARFFYESDCYSLNKKARFFYPFHYRLGDFIGNIFPWLNKTTAHIHMDKDIAEKLKNKLRTINLHIDWQQNMREGSYVVFDTETTGLYAFKGDKIISVGAVTIEKGEIKKDQVFDQIVYPGRPIPRTASDITGITDNLVSGKPPIHHVLLDFINYTGNKILVAHNAAFDLAFLNIALSQLGKIRIVNPVIDTYVLAKIMLPDMIDYSLENLTKRFNIKMEGRHTALGDSFMTAKIFLSLMEKLENKNVLTLSQLASFLSWEKRLANRIKP